MMAADAILECSNGHISATGDLIHSMFGFGTISGSIKPKMAAMT